MPYGDPGGNFAGTGNYGGNYGAGGFNNSMSGGYGGTGGWGTGLQGGWTSGIMGQTRDSQAAAAGANAPRSDSTNGYVPGQPLITQKPLPPFSMAPTPITPGITPGPMPPHMAPPAGFGIPDPMQGAWSNVGSAYPGRLPGMNGVITGNMGTGYGPYGRQFDNPVSNAGLKGDYQGGGIAIGRR